MKSSKINSTNDINLNIKAYLNQLGAALIFPLSFLAFTSIFLGLSYSLPDNLFLADALRKFILIIFSFFPLLAYVSLINVFSSGKNETTIISSLIFLMTILSIMICVNKTFNTNISFDLFASLIISFSFLFINHRFKIYHCLWVLIAFVTSVIFIPLIWLVSIIINSISIIISLLPLGLNSFTYGFSNRLLLPFGLHSLMIPTFAYSNVGGYINIYNSGELVQVIGGDSLIWMNLYSSGIKDFSLSGTVVNEGIEYTYEVIGNNNPGMYQQGFLPITSIVFPMVAFSYYYIVDNEKGKLFLMGALLTCFSGITETTEYFFILINPFLYLLNAVMVGLSFMLCDLFNVHVWLSTGWSIDVILFGVVPWVKGYQTNWYYILIIGFIVGVLYSSLFIVIDKHTKYVL